MTGSGPVTTHELLLYAASYTPAQDQVPGGSVAAVKGTPFDFTTPHKIGERIEQTGGKPAGYDHNFVLSPKGDKRAGGLPLAVRVSEPTSGRVMEVYTDQPGVQFYTGNFLDGTLTHQAVFQSVDERQTVASLSNVAKSAAWAIDSLPVLSGDNAITIAVTDTAGNKTRGHRFHAPREFTVSSPKPRSASIRACAP